MLNARRLIVFVGCLLLLACSGADELRARAASGPDATRAARSENALHRPSRALAYVRGDSPTDALIAHAQRAVAAAPDEVRPYTGLATLMLRRQAETGDPAYLRLADDALQGALSRDPEDVAARTLEILLLTHEHRFAAARDRAHDLATSRIQDPTPFLLLGDAQLELGDLEAAVDAYQSAMDLRPDLRSYNRGAYVRWLTDDTDGAVELLADALQAGSVRDPSSSAWCLTDLARVHWSRGELDQAERAADRALALLPSYPEGLRWRSRLQHARADGAAGLATIERIANPTIEDRLWAAELYVELGDRTRADAIEARAREDVREDPRALALFDARHNQHADAAVALAQAELEVRPNLWSYDVYAVALARAGRHSEAQTAMARALAWSTPDPRLILHRALVELEAGDREAASADLSRALTMNPHVDPPLARELTRRLGA